METHIGTVIRHLRKKRNISQENLAIDICSREHLNRIEQGKTEPTTYIIGKFSERLGTDIYNYYADVLYQKSIATHLLIEELNELIGGPMDALSAFLTTLDKHPDFKDGEPFQHLCYGHALFSAHAKQNHEEALDYCMKGLESNSNLLNNNLTPTDFYRSITLILYHTLALNYCRLGDINNGLQHLRDLNSYCKQFLYLPKVSIYKNHHFHINMYVLSLYNIFIYDDQADPSALFEQIHEAIAILLKLEYSCRLSNLLHAQSILARRLDLEDAEVYEENYQTYKQLLKTYPTTS